MYLAHFGLKEPPFSLTPDTEFFFDMGSYHTICNMLMIAIASKKGIIKVVGEGGTGKTMICHKVLGMLDESPDFVTAHIAYPLMSPKGLLLEVAEALGIAAESDIGHHSLLKRISQTLIEQSAAGRQVVLLIDEAHNMPEKTLEASKLLTSLETDSAQFIQVVLFAQPKLNETLKNKSLRQLQRRITISCKLEALDRIGLRRYVMHRMATAGCNNDDVFSSKALDDLFRASRGIPRMVNIVCHKALLIAHRRGDRSVEREHMSTAISDTEEISLPPRIQFRPIAASTLVALAGAALVAYLLAYYL